MTDEMQAKFVKICTTLHETTKRDILRNYTSKQNDYNELVQNLQRQLTKAIREARQHERSERHELTAEDWEREYKLIINHPKVIRIEVDPYEEIIYVHTRKLYCTHPDTKQIYEIGEFKIIVPLKSGIPRWINQTRRVEIKEKGWRMHHPHIFNDKACLGTATGLFPKLLGNYEFAAAVSMAIEFVESVNINDEAGRYITRFPEVDKKGRLKELKTYELPEDDDTF